MITRRNSEFDHPNALSRERLLQYGQGEDYIRLMGEMTISIRKEVVLVETQIPNSAIVQYGERPT